MVEIQAYLFLIFTINGIIIGLLFDIFRILRKSFKTSDIITYLQDLIFWIITAIILLYSIFKFSNGEIRLYMFIAVFLGCIIYMLQFSKYFIKINLKIVNVIKIIITKIINVMVIPLNATIKIFKKITIKPINFITINIKNMNLKKTKKQNKISKNNI